MNKNASCNKVLGEEIKFLKKDLVLISAQNHSYWKKFHVKSDKKYKIFFFTTVSKFHEISTLNICDGAKQIYPSKQKKCSKKRYSTNFSSSHPEF